MFSIPMSVVKNTDILILNSDIHNIYTRRVSDLHHPMYKLTDVQKGVTYSGIMLFNNLPQNIKNLSSDANKFKNALIKFLHTGPFYTLSEYAECKMNEI
jgi:hypothetical protein